MTSELKLIKTVETFLSNQVAAFGFAPVSRFENAPEAHHPGKLCKNAETIIVYAIEVPRGILKSPEYDLHTMHRSYHTVYSRIDDVALDLCNRIEKAGEYLAVPVPAYAPMVFHGVEPWGLLSLKHAAVNAGLGGIGRNGLLHHPDYGTMLRLGAVVTDAVFPASELNNDYGCPEKCGACIKACPSNAFDDNGEFTKMTCLGHTIKHAFYPIAFKEPDSFNNIEQIINTAGYNYWLDCNRCISVCPMNRVKEAGNE